MSYRKRCDARRISIPGLRLVSESNCHTHWRERQKRAKAQRRAVGWHLAFASASLRFEIARTPLVVTITRVAPRRLDSDNAVGSAKHVRDAIAKLLGIDDADERVEWIVGQQKGDYAVRIEIEEAAAKCPTCGRMK